MIYLWETVISSSLAPFNHQRVDSHIFLDGNFLCRFLYVYQAGCISHSYPMQNHYKNPWKITIDPMIPGGILHQKSPQYPNKKPMRSLGHQILGSWCARLVFCLHCWPDVANETRVGISNDSLVEHFDSCSYIFWIRIGIYIYRYIYIYTCICMYVYIYIYIVIHK